MASESFLAKLSAGETAFKSFHLPDEAGLYVIYPELAIVGESILPGCISQAVAMAKAHGIGSIRTVFLMGKTKVVFTIVSKTSASRVTKDRQ